MAQILPIRFQEHLQVHFKSLAWVLGHVFPITASECVLTSLGVKDFRVAILACKSYAN